MKKITSLITCLIGLSVAMAQPSERAAQVKTENQPIADLGNGYYKNPVLPGGWGDPTAVKVGNDYYLANRPGNSIMIWHSKDLVNWEPVIRHSLGKDFETIWAIDISYFDNKFHVYMPIGKYPGKTETEENHQYFKAVWMISAEKPEGPWSEPVRVDKHYNPDPFYTGIDPGFIQTPEGKKYLYVDNGFMMPLNADGTSSTAMPKVVYEGWDYPKEWVVQGKCLESPKLLYKDGYYYIVSAEGGTSGPSTAHMTTVARSKSPEGPWETSPYNPLVHTYSESEAWWQQGHGTIIEGPNNTWWTLYPSRPAWYTGMGKQSVLMPIEWVGGWPRIKVQQKPWDVIAKPQGENVGGGMPLSDNFKSDELGIQWNITDANKLLVKPGNGKLVVIAQGESSKDATNLSVNATNKSYEVTVEVEVEVDKNVTAGLVFNNNEGLKFDGNEVSYNLGGEWRTRNSEVKVAKGQTVYLKIRNYRQDLSFFASLDGENWVHFQNGVRSASYNVRLFAAGNGKAVFRNFRYLGID